MDPHAWIRKLQRNVEPHQRSGVNNSTGGPSTTRDTDWEDWRYTEEEPCSSNRVNVGWKEPSPSSHNFYSKESEVMGPDGEPMKMDLELARKRKTLRDLEQKIMFKKVSIALKTVEPVIQNTTSLGFSRNNHSASTLRDRVNRILQQRDSFSVLAKSAPERTNSSSLGGGLLLEDHPLKLRVKALMRQRCRGSDVLPTTRQVPDVPPLPPSQSVASPVQEEGGSNKGFQCFLSLLNKGVDMDLLSRIVNDDSEDLPSGELNVDRMSHLRRESQRSNSRERKTDLLSPEQSHNESHSLPDEENDRGHERCFSSSSRSTFSPTAKGKKNEEVGKPKAEEQREQLQNVLKALGLSLEGEEMRGLADRTQERLYGKKREGRQRADSREEQESGHSRPSSSFCSSYSPSRPTSRSISPSPSRLPHSHSTDPSDGPEPGRDGVRQGERSEETSSFQHPYPPEQVYPSTHHPAYSAFPDSSMAQYSQHTAYYNDSYSTATSSYWTQTQVNIPPPPHPSGYPYPHNTYSPFPVAPPNMVYPHYQPHQHNHLSTNPHQSMNKGQSGSYSRPRCLQVINTKQTNNQSSLQQPTKRSKKKKKRKSRTQNHPSGNRNKPPESEGQTGSPSGLHSLHVSTEESKNEERLQQREDMNFLVNGDLDSEDEDSLSGFTVTIYQSKSQIKKQMKNKRWFVNRRIMKYKKRLAKLGLTSGEVPPWCRDENFELSEEGTEGSLITQQGGMETRKSVRLLLKRRKESPQEQTSEPKEVGVVPEEEKPQPTMVENENNLGEVNGEEVMP